MLGRLQPLSVHGGTYGRHRRGLRLVRNGQPLPALGPATGEHNAAVLSGHAAPETVRLLPAASVRLKSALTLHSVCIYRKLPGTPKEPVMLCVARRECQRSSSFGAMFRRVVVHSAVQRNVTCRPQSLPLFGLFPKFSTTVENAVGNRGIFWVFLHIPSIFGRNPAGESVWWAA